LPLYSRIAVHGHLESSSTSWTAVHRSPAYDSLCSAMCAARPRSRIFRIVHIKKCRVNCNVSSRQVVGPYPAPPRHITSCLHQVPLRCLCIQPQPAHGQDTGRTQGGKGRRSMYPRTHACMYVHTRRHAQVIQFSDTDTIYYPRKACVPNSELTKHAPSKHPASSQPNTPLHLTLSSLLSHTPAQSIKLLPIPIDYACGS
jgi:hypothetical protein